MRRPSPRTLFLAAMALALGLPLLGWFGLPGFVGAHGFDTPDVPPPPPTPANLVSGRFREGVAAHWGHVFFGRTELLFLKNGLFDLASGGRYHAGDMTGGEVLDSYMRYLPAKDAWEWCGTMPCGRAENQIAFRIDGKVYFGLGEDEEGRTINKLYCIEE